ncbi:MAG: hypothetical protein R2856_29075 [Caldilineaceae bacterium]
MTVTAPIYTSQGISTDPVDDVTPMVVRFFPGYQETIYGAEDGIILSKRIFAPLGSGYDRSVLWLMECQAEGDRLLRIEVDIDWGAPLEQRMVDGLLVAQTNPLEAQGIHGQQNAESTRVFGTGGGRPDWVDLDDPSRAQLVYHLLVAGQVDLPLILTVSDVGEQVAWNGFLALRDISRSFKLSQDVWTKVSRSGRLWTPYAPLNRVVQMGKEDAVAELRRLRTGYAPADQKITSVPALVDLFDSFDFERSRALLDHVRRLAMRTSGRLPGEIPAMPGEEAKPTTAEIVLRANVAYLTALASHLSRQPSVSYLAEHYAAVQACSDVLLSIRRERSTLAILHSGLYVAARLAGQHGDNVNEARWIGEAAVLGQLPSATGGVDLRTWQGLDALRNFGAPDAVHPLDAAAQLLWQGCGISVRDGEIYLSPQWPTEWGWWGVLDLPILGGSLSLLWDGERLHASRPVRFGGEVTVWERIRADGSDADDFRLHFHLRNSEQRRMFRPIFYEEVSWGAQRDVRGKWIGD